MDEYLDISSLAEQTEKYQPILEKHADDGLAFATKVAKVLDKKVLSLVITNYQKAGSQARVFYVLRINRDHIELAEASPTSKNNIIFSFEDNGIQLNRRKMSPVFFGAFGIRIRKILTDVKQMHATVYEEHHS